MKQYSLKVLHCSYGSPPLAQSLPTSVHLLFSKPIPKIQVLFSHCILVYQLVTLIENSPSETCVFLVSTIPVIHHLDFIALPILGYMYNSQSSLLHNILSSPLTSSLELKCFLKHIV